VSSLLVFAIFFPLRVFLAFWFGGTAGKNFEEEVVVFQLCFNSRGEILVADSSFFFPSFPRETLQTLVLPRRDSTLKLLVVSTHQQLFIKCAKRRETHRWREPARPTFFAVNHWVEGEERHTYLYVQESRVRVQDSPLLEEFPTSKINEHCVAENPICSSKTKPAKLGAIRLRKHALEEEGGEKGKNKRKKHPFHRCPFAEISPLFFFTLFNVSIAARSVFLSSYPN
jgi:hypothetical protein